MDPHGVLGLAPGATPDEAVRAFRRLAKEWHPDRGGGRAAEQRMAEINAAYDLLRAAAWNDRHDGRSAESPPTRSGIARPGGWLLPAIRRALGRELLATLEPGEAIWLVTPATTWASPQALLAASDRRLLWLLDDAVANRVHSLPFEAIATVEHVVRRPRRRVSTLRVHARNGRRITFGHLRPATAAALAQRISGTRAELREPRPMRP